MKSKYFKRYEFACKCGCGFDVVDSELLEVLEGLREHFNNPIIITSGNRCATHNNAIGGENKSQHMLGKAVDIKIKDIHEDEVVAYLERHYSDMYGIGRYVGRTHIDVREQKARWDFR